MATALQRILIVTAGFDEEAFTTSTPGTEQTLLSFTIGPSLIRKLHIARILCRFNSLAKLQLNGVTIATLATGPGQYSDEFKWDVPKKAVAGDLIQLKFEQIAMTPATAVGAFLNMSDV